MFTHVSSEPARCAGATMDHMCAHYCAEHVVTQSRWPACIRDPPGSARRASRLGLCAARWHPVPCGQSSAQSCTSPRNPRSVRSHLPRSAVQPAIMAPWIANATSDTAQTHIARLSLSRAQPPAAPLRSRIMSSQHIASGWMRANARHVPCQGRGSDAALHAAMLLCVRAAQGATR